MDWFLCDRDLRHDRVNMILNTPQFSIYNAALLNATGFYLYINKHFLFIFKISVDVRFFLHITRSR